MEESAPRIRPRRSKLRERLLYAVDPESQPKALIRSDLSQLIVRHQLDGFAAEQASVADLSFVKHHLAEPRIVHCGRNQPSAAGEKFLRPLRRIIRRVNKRSFRNPRVRKPI